MRISEWSSDVCSSDRNQYEKLNPELKSELIRTQMQRDLRMKVLPRHIECFDNSNFQGKYPVSAVVVFKDARPSKKDYRHFNVKTVEGPNDFATMEEAVHRRYRRLVDEGQTLQIGRASCRERGSIRVDLGGRRSSNKKKRQTNKQR